MGKLATLAEMLGEEETNYLLDLLKNRTVPPSDRVVQALDGTDPVAARAERSLTLLRVYHEDVREGREAENPPPPVESCVPTELVPDREFTVYAAGVCGASVCTSLADRDEIEQRMNAEHPSGTESGWKISDEDFARPKPAPNPNPCEQSPSTHKHYLMEC